MILGIIHDVRVIADLAQGRIELYPLLLSLLGFLKQKS